MVIGGENYNSVVELFSKKKFHISEYLESKNMFKEYEVSYSFGGHYSLIRILLDMNLSKSDVVLLPSYLCPSMLYPLKYLNIKYRFYKMKFNLDIDFSDLENKVDSSVKGILFINYFGFPLVNQHKLKKYQKEGIILIQDVVQSFFSDIEYFGDYVYNSFRKFLPIDGSIILAKKRTELSNKLFNNYKLYKIIGQYLRYIYIKYNIGSENLFLYFTENAKKLYYNINDDGFHIYDKYLLSRLDIFSIMEKRRKNYDILNERYKNSLFPKREEGITPLFFPLLLENRNEIRIELAKKNIYAPIHWNIPLEINKDEFKESYKLSSAILSIPIDDKVDQYELEYLINTFEELKLTRNYINV